jgi:hypothetical protein
MEAGRMAAAIEVANARSMRGALPIATTASSADNPTGGNTGVSEAAHDTKPSGLGEDLGAEFGDRRQELVFIGYFRKPADAEDGDTSQGVAGGNPETRIRKLLDSCLLTDRELVYYRKQQSERNLLT